MIRRIDPATKSKADSFFLDSDSGFACHSTGWRVRLITKRERRYTGYADEHDPLVIHHFALEIAPPGKGSVVLDALQITNPRTFRAAIFDRLGYFVSNREMTLLFGGHKLSSSDGILQAMLRCPEVTPCTQR